MSQRPTMRDLIRESGEKLDEIQRNKAVVLVSQPKQQASAKQSREVS